MNLKAHIIGHLHRVLSTHTLARAQVPDRYEFPGGGTLKYQLCGAGVQCVQQGRQHSKHAFSHLGNIYPEILTNISRRFHLTPFPPDFGTFVFFQPRAVSEQAAYTLPAEPAVSEQAGDTLPAEPAVSVQSGDTPKAEPAVSVQAAGTLPAEPAVSVQSAGTLPAVLPRDGPDRDVSGLTKTKKNCDKSLQFACHNFLLLTAHAGIHTVALLLFFLSYSRAISRYIDTVVAPYISDLCGKFTFNADGNAHNFWDEE